MIGTVKERFWAKISPEPNSGCWLWDGGSTAFGYGRIWVDGKIVPATRVSWNLYRGEIPDGLLVLHKCDVPRCCNPDHLFLGTQQDNRDDCKNKGRNIFGEKNHNASLTAELVNQIKLLLRLGARQRRIARAFNVSRMTISDINTGRGWAHLL